MYVSTFLPAYNFQQISNILHINMKRAKNKIKKECVEPSTSNAKEEHDLAYYIHDRVELMHQVFSVIKSKDLKAMAPECVRNLSVDDLQELCLGELLGISSKRLCAVLDGAEPPSDTESSSQSLEHLETISLDSISSDDEILSETSKKSKKKIRHRRNSKHKRKKTKGHKDKNKSPVVDDDAEKSTASRAGLTVLELLELQARARAIRAQLQKEQVTKKTSETVMQESNHTTDDDVEIKEEPAEVVEISSEEEKPNVVELEKQSAVKSSVNNSGINKDTETQLTEKVTDNLNKITKITNDLVITVPQSKPSRKIKLNRNKVTISVPNISEKNLSKNATKKVAPLNDVISKVSSKVQEADDPKFKSKDKSKKRTKKKTTKSNNVKEGSDHDEITLELSDTEKMDLLEDLDRKNFEEVSSSSSEDTDSSSSDSNSSKTSIIKHKDVDTVQAIQNNDNGMAQVEKNETESNENIIENVEPISDPDKRDNNVTCCEIPNELIKEDKNMTEVFSKDNKSDANKNEVTNENKHENIENNENNEPIAESIRKDENNCEVTCITDLSIIQNKESQKEFENKNIEEVPQKSSPKITNTEIKEMSEGEISDQESSEVEAVDLQPEVVCISDEEKSKKEKKNKKKKDKKNKKKAKKSKQKSDFQEGSDQNFFNDMDNSLSNQILELSDDSSCYEVEGVSVLSKEPTADEIAALSAKIDEIERVEVITDKEIQEHEQQEAGTGRSCSEEEIENISWKDRYLGSKKVKKVLTTSNIMNAIRKKNKELKNKLAESKKIEVIEPEIQEKTKDSNLEEGSIEHYNTLQGSTTYVDPVSDPTLEASGEKDTKESKEAETPLTNAMKKDAKQLLKMYKRLLKYNDMNKQKNPTKKKKKRKEKNKESTAKITN